MSKKTSVATIIILGFLFSLAVGMQAVKVSKANPYEPPPFYPPTPNTDPISITMQSPTNTSYNIASIPLNITLTQPSSWHQNNLTVGYVMNVSYEIDDKANVLWRLSPDNPPPILPPTSNFSAALENLTQGQHTLRIIVDTYSIYDSHQSTNWHLTDTYYTNATQTVLFTVNQPSTTPSLTPTLITQPTMRTAGSETQFKLNIAYAYVGQGPSNASYTANNGYQMSPVSQYLSAVILNITRVPSAQLASCDAEIEFYKVQIAADTGEVENHGYFVGSNNKPSLQSSDLTSLTADIGGPYGFIVLSDSSDTRGDFQFNWTQNTSIVFPQSIGSIGCYSGGPTGAGLWGAGTPNAISVAIYRIGYATITNGSVSMYKDASNESAVATQQLSSYGNGFLYNTLITSDKLSQTDLFHPVPYPTPSLSSSPSPSPSPTSTFSPSSTQASTPTPTPTISTTFPQPTPPPPTTQQPNFSSTILPTGYAYAIIAASIITIIVSISLLYLQRTKNQKRMIE